MTYQEHLLYKKIEELEKSLENANQKIQALTTTLITHYDKSWFDQTVKF
jgi:prefoldin subunit 5